jgi:hypothetical protein
MSMTLRIVALILLAILPSCRKPEPARHTPELITQQEPAAKKATSAESGMIAALIDPEKLATLKDRGSNPRILKITAILFAAKGAGKNPETIVAGAIEQIDWGGTAKGNLTAAAILRNLDIAEKLGSTTEEDIDAMRRGRSPSVRKGPYSGDILSVDHIIPRAILPELDNVIANLELMPLRLNQSKNDKIGDRQRDLANKFHAAGLLADPVKVH